MVLSRNTNIIIISAVFSVLAIVAVLMRFRARMLQRVGFQADDYLIIPGLVFSIGIGATNIAAAILGNLGNHVQLGEDGAPKFDDSLTVYKQTDFATQLLSILALAFTQLSILFLYRRIFTGRLFSKITNTIIVLVCAWAASFFFADLLQCIPTNEIWTSWEGQPGHLEHCYNYIPMFYGTAISHMIMDLLILSIPVPMVWKLQMPTSQKLAVTGIFMLGAFVVGISVARVYFFFSVGANIERAWDITYERAPTIYWSQLEAAIAIVCACLPTLRVLFVDISLETIAKRFASKISLLSGSKSSFRTMPKPSQGSISSASGLQQTGEAVRLSSLDQPYGRDFHGKA